MKSNAAGQIRAGSQFGELFWLGVGGVREKAKTGLARKVVQLNTSTPLTVRPNERHR